MKMVHLYAPFFDFKGFLHDTNHKTAESMLIQNRFLVVTFR